MLVQLNWTLSFRMRLVVEPNPTMNNMLKFNPKINTINKIMTQCTPLEKLSNEMDISLYETAEYLLLGERNTYQRKTVNEWRLKDNLNVIRPWFQNFEPLTTFPAKLLNGYDACPRKIYEITVFKNYLPEEFDKLEKLRDCYSDEIIGAWNLNINPYYPNDLDYFKLCPLVGMNEDVQTYMLEQYFMNEGNLSYEDKLYFMENMFKYKTLPLILPGLESRTWIPQLPHESMIEFLNDELALSESGMCKMLSYMERKSTALKGNNVACQCSDGVVIQEPVNAYAQVGTENNIQNFVNKHINTFIYFSNVDLDYLRNVVHKPIAQIFDFKIDISSFLTDFSMLSKEISSNIIKALEPVVGSVITITKTIIKFIILIGFYLACSYIKKEILNDNLLLSLCLILGFNATCDWYLKDFPQAQSGERNSPIPLFILSEIFGYRPSRSTLKDITYFLANAPRAVMGIEYLFEHFKDLFQYCSDFLSKHVLRMEIRELDSVSPVIKWTEQCIEICKEYQTSQHYHFDDGHYSQVRNLWLKGLELSRNPLLRTEHQYISNLNNKIYNLLEKFPEKYRLAEHGQVRAPPAAVYLYGDTGVGKSTITYPLCTEVISHILFENDPELEIDPTSEIYSRNIEQEYWDGYRGQAITVYDDFAQRVDSTSSPNNEFFEIIRTTNIFPYPLHMADIAQKDCTYFSSKMLFSSSNVSPDRVGKMICSLKYPPAVLRRLGTIIKVEGNGKEKPIDGTFSHDCYKFILEEYDFTTPDYKMTSSKEISYDELVSLLVLKYKHNMRISDTVGEHCKLIQEKVRQKYRDLPKAQILAEYLEKFVSIPRNEYDDQQELVKFEHQDILMPCYFDLLDFASNRLSMFKYDMQRSWEIIYRGLIERFHIIPIILSVWNVVVLIVGGVSLYKMISKNFFSEKQKQSIELTQTQLNNHTRVEVPILESNERNNNMNRIKMESNEKDGAKNNMRLESGEREGVVPKIRLESNEKNEVTPKLKLESQNLPVATKSIVTQNEYNSAVAEGLVAQGLHDVNASEVLGKLMIRNLYAIYLEMNNTTIRIGHVIVVKGKVCIMPYHFVPTLRSYLKQENESRIVMQCIFKGAPKVVYFLSDFLDLKFYQPSAVEGKISDVCSFYLPALHQHSDIVKFFVPKSDSASTVRSRVVLPTLQFPQSTKYEPYATMSFGNADSIITLKNSFNYLLTGVGNEPDQTICLRSAWKYQLETKGGDCGAPCVLINPSIANGRVVGIHVAGCSDGYGYAMPLSREDVCSLVDKVEIIAVSQQFSEKIELGANSVLPFKGKFIPLGKADITVASASKTSITPSLFNETNPHTKQILAKSTMKPAWLLPGTFENQPWDPRIYRLEKFGTDLIPVKINFFSKAVKAYLNYLKPKIAELDLDITHIKSKYTFEEACEGFLGDHTLNPIKRNTSAGYPLCSLVKKGKKEIFGAEGPFQYDTTVGKLVRNQWEQTCAEIENGIRNLSVFVNTLKDEKKPIEKAHKTRLFSAGSLLDLLLCRTYFMKAVSILTHLKIDCMIAVGTNVYSYDWTKLAINLLSKGENFVAGDFEGFDSSQQKEILRQACEILICLCDDPNLEKEERQKHEKARRVLMDNLLESVHYDFGELSMWIKGLPSGHYLTALVNSLFVILSFVYSFWRASGLNANVAVDVFFKDFFIITYGDDHVICIPDKWKNVFNQLTVKNYLSELGLSYTTEDKKEAEFETRKLSEVTFLKRSFVYNDEQKRYDAPIVIDTIRECLLWVKKSEDPYLALEANIGFALRELSLHKDCVWNEWYDRITECAYKHGIKVEYSSKDSAYYDCINEQYTLTQM
uniref:Nonstructural polyprotein n=1 Tax=Perth bee virus 1 TaxID=2201295 RepID=A0A2U8JQC0_9VIRU|nr:nonstructural polyprotein [Perth bee virus 1]